MVIVVIVVVVLIVPVVGHCSWWHFDCCCYYYYSSTDDPPRHGTTTIFLFRRHNNNSTHHLMFLRHDDNHHHHDGYNGYLSWSVQRSRRPSRNHQPQYIHRDLQMSVRCIPVAVTMRVMMTMAKRHSHGYSRWYCRCGSCTSPINGVVHRFIIWSILIRPPPPPLHHHHHLRCRNYCCRSPPLP